MAIGRAAILLFCELKARHPCAKINILKEVHREIHIELYLKLTACRTVRF